MDFRGRLHMLSASFMSTGRPHISCATARIAHTVVDCCVGTIGPAPGSRFID